MADHAEAAGSEGEAQSNFLLPSGSASEEQVGNVHGGDENNQDHGSHQHQHHGADIAHERLLQRLHRDGPFGEGRIIRREFSAQLARHDIQACLRLAQTDSGPETRDRSGQEPPIAGRRRKRISAESGSPPDLDVFGHRFSRMAKRGRKHTHDGVDIIVEPEGAPENIGVCAVRAAPQAIADDGRQSETAGEIFGTKQASQLWCCS